MGTIVTGPSSAIQPVQIPDLAGDYARLALLRNQLQEAPLRQQALQQQVQAGDLENQQRQQALKNQQAITQAYQQWDGKDYNDLAHFALKAGATGDAVQGLQQHGLTLRETASKIASQDAETGSKIADTIRKQNQGVAGTLQGVLDAPEDQMPQMLISTAQQLSQQKKADGTPMLDPQHLQIAQSLAQQGPKAIRQALPMFQKDLLALDQQLESAQKQAATNKDNAEAQNARGKIDPTSPLYAPSPSSVAMGTAPGAAQIQANEVAQAGKKAAAEASSRQPFEMALAKQRQALSQGDPSLAAKLLIDGDATLSELKARGSTPDFIARTLFQAKQMSGGKYNPQEAEANFKVAQSPTNVAFFGSAKSLTEKGGTLDQLMEAAKSIPQNQIPVFNSLEDWAKEASGSGPLAHYASLVLGVADDYSKVMGGGQGSDSSRLQAANLVSKKLSAEGREGAVSGIRGAVNSQITGRIGKNPIMQRMYGESEATTNAPASGGVTVTAPNGKTYSFKDQASADAFKQKAGIQ